MELFSYSTQHTGYEGGKKMRRMTAVLLICLFGFLLVSTSCSEVTAPRIILSETEVRLAVGKSIQLKAVIENPVSGEKGKATWESSEPAVCAVSSAGAVKAVSAGTAVITCTITFPDGGRLSSECKVSSFVTAKSLKAVNDNIDVNVGQTAMAEFEILPENTAEKTLDWTSANEAVAIVDEDGKITGIAAGTAKVTGQTKDGSRLRTVFTVHVPTLAVEKTDYTVSEVGGLTIPIFWYGADFEKDFSVQVYGKPVACLARLEEGQAVLHLTALEAGDSEIEISDKKDKKSKVILAIHTKKEAIPYDELLTALGNDAYRAAYQAMLSGEVIKNGSKGNAVKGLQQTLSDFGRKIAVNGKANNTTISILNDVQKTFGLEVTDSLDAEGYILLLTRLLPVISPDTADGMLKEQMETGEYEYLKACILVNSGKYFSAMTAFRKCGWGDWEERAESCVQPWPKTGVLFSNPDVKGGNTELAVKVNAETDDTAMLVKIYTLDNVLARTMFIGGSGKASTRLPAGRYIIKDGTGKNWYGEEEAFGSEGSYEIMTFGDNEQNVELMKNYQSTITVNVEEIDPHGQSVGTDRENWGSF